MGGEGMNGEKLSARQLSVAVLVGGLSTAAAVAGGADWRWMLGAAVLAVAMGWLLLRRIENRPLHPALRAVYCAWSVVLMAEVLRRTAERVQQTAGDREGIGWVLVLLALPLLWMGWGKAAAFFRTVEIFWLAALVMTAAIVLLALPRLDWPYALKPVGDWRGSLSAAAEVFSAGLFALPHLYKVKDAPGARRGLSWLAALGAVAAALCLVTAGLLSPAVAGRLDGPFFAAAGLLGDSARLEGLISALWLLPDLTLAGLMSRAWGEKRWPVLGVLLALGVSLTGLTGGWPVAVLAGGSLALAVLTLLVPPEKGKIVVQE